MLWPMLPVLATTALLGMLAMALLSSGVVGSVVGSVAAAMGAAGSDKGGVQGASSSWRRSWRTLAPAGARRALTFQVLVRLGPVVFGCAPTSSSVEEDEKDLIHAAQRGAPRPRRG